ncbi:hypothetical protein L804_03702 [Cryptococcus deuterogattii 2001/935-1]|nr:hypothetical protein L804_03702 [Cryptococcus deuterogattii 2001/935-1]
MFDVPTTYLPRFFLSLPSSPSIILTDPIESLPSIEETMVLCPDMEWRCGARSWKGALNMVVGRRGKIEKMDVVLGNKNDEGEMFVKGALRVLNRHYNNSFRKSEEISLFSCFGTQTIGAAYNSVMGEGNI